MSRLKRPLRRFSLEAAWLAKEFAAASKLRTDSTSLICEMAVVRLHDSWARACRDLVVCSACGATTTLGGAALHTSPLVQGGEGAVIPALLATFRNKKTEPKWFDVGECVDAAQRLQVGNLSTVAAGLGANTSPAEVVRAVRNFYAHRGRYTAQQAGQTGIFAKPQLPDVFELARPARAGLSHVEFWIVGLTDTLRAASQ